MVNPRAAGLLVVLTLVLVGCSPSTNAKSTDAAAGLSRFYTQTLTWSGLTDTQLDQFVAQDPAPNTPSEVDAVVAGDKTFDAGCQARSAMLLPYVGTPNAARDMDILRAALGDQKMYYLGASYGTYLGAVYAGLFPTHIARAVLDGPVSPNLTTMQLARVSGIIRSWLPLLLVRDDVDVRWVYDLSARCGVSSGGGRRSRRGGLG